jgi:hypothetical protein
MIGPMTAAMVIVVIRILQAVTQGWSNNIAIQLDAFHRKSREFVSSPDIVWSRSKSKGANAGSKG